MLVVETLVALVEHSLEREPTLVSDAFKRVLQSVGAGPDTSRSAVADVLAESTAASIVRLFTCIPQDVRPEALLEELAVWVAPSGGDDAVPAATGAGRWPGVGAPGGAPMVGFGMSRVVPLDALVAFVAVVGNGSLEERARVAFWTLDRDGAGYLTLDQLLRFSTLLVAVAAAGRLILRLPLLPQGSDPAAGGPLASPADATSGGSSGPPHSQAAGAGGTGAAAGVLAGAGVAGAVGVGQGWAGGVASSSPLSSTSRALIDSALYGAFHEHCLPAEGPGGLQARLTVERIVNVAQSTAEHLTLAVVQGVTSSSQPHSHSLSHSQPHLHAMPSRGGLNPNPSAASSRTGASASNTAPAPTHLQSRTFSRLSASLVSPPGGAGRGHALGQGSPGHAQHAQQQQNPQASLHTLSLGSGAGAVHDSLSIVMPQDGTSPVSPLGQVSTPQIRQGQGQGQGGGSAGFAFAPDMSNRGSRGGGDGSTAIGGAAAGMGARARAAGAPSAQDDTPPGAAPASAPRGPPDLISPSGSLQPPRASASSQQLAAAFSTAFSWSRPRSSFAGSSSTQVPAAAATAPSAAAGGNASLHRVVSSISSTMSGVPPPPRSGGGGMGWWIIPTAIGQAVYWGLGWRPAAAPAAESLERPGGSPPAGTIAGSSSSAPVPYATPASGEAGGLGRTSAGVATSAGASQSAPGASTLPPRLGPYGPASISITMLGPDCPTPGSGRQLDPVHEHPDSSAASLKTPVRSQLAAPGANLSATPNSVSSTPLAVGPAAPSAVGGGFGGGAATAADLDSFLKDCRGPTGRPSTVALEMVTLAGDTVLTAQAGEGGGGGSGNGDGGGRLGTPAGVALGGSATTAVGGGAGELASGTGGTGGGGGTAMGDGSAGTGSGAGSGGGAGPSAAPRARSGLHKLNPWRQRRVSGAVPGRLSTGGDPGANIGGDGQRADSAAALAPGGEGAATAAQLLYASSISGRRPDLAFSPGGGLDRAITGALQLTSSMLPDEAVKRAEEQAQATRIQPRPGGVGGGGGVGSGGGGGGAGGGGVGGRGTVLPPLQRAIRSSLQQAGVKLFLHCGLCLLSIIALLLLDAALVAWIYLDREQRLSLSLVIVAATNGGLVLLVLVVSIVRSCMADRAAALEARTAEAQRAAGGTGGGGGVLETALTNFVTPLVTVFRGPDGGGGLGSGGGAAGGHQSGDPGGGWVSRLRVLWTTVGRVAGFDTQLPTDATNDSPRRSGGMAVSGAGNLEHMSYGYHMHAHRTIDLESAAGGMTPSQATGGAGLGVGMASPSAQTSGRGHLYGPDPHLLAMQGNSVGGAGGPAMTSAYGMHANAGLTPGVEIMVGGGSGGDVGLGLGADPRDSGREGGTGPRQRTRGTAVGGFQVPTISAYP